MITGKGYGKPVLQPTTRQYTRGYLSYRWYDAFGYRPSKRRLRRQLAKLKRIHGPMRRVLMPHAVARNQL